MTNPQDDFLTLVSPGIIPNPVDSTDDFMRWFYGFYADLQNTINTRKAPYYEITITNTPTNLPLIPNFGAYIVLVSGIQSTLPAASWAVAKSTSGAVGVVNSLASQAGSGATWAAQTLTLSTSLQISHSLANTEGRFNVRWIGTQI